MNNDMTVSNKYAVFYKYNEVVFGEVTSRWNTNFKNHNGKYCYGFPAYDTVEEANKELLRYALCKEQMCDKEKGG